MHIKNFVSLAVVFLMTAIMGQANNCANIQDILPKLDTVFQPNAGSKIYISNLSFLDAKTRSVMAAGDAELLNEAVKDGMSTLANTDKRYVINDPQHRLENNDANATKLSDLFWDANMPREQKVEKIVADLMEPAGIDGLIFGQFTEDTDGITVRPIVVTRRDKKLVTETKKFKVDEYNCTDPNNASRKVLCQKAKEEVRDIVVRLLSTM
jgi:hypothetical protein